MKKLLLFIALLISALGLNAQSVTIGDLEFTVTSETPAECEVSGYSGEPTDVTIPSTVTISGMEFSVTSIGNDAFSNCTSLTSIEIPNSVTSIGEWAFSYCDNLTSIEIPNSVTSIGYFAFYNCSNLTSIEIPNSVTYIDNGAFSGCDNLTSITVEEGNPVYDSRNNCNAIIETETNTLIAGCQNTIIPNSVTSINYAFMGCTSLTSIEIPNSVTYIGNYAFSDCDNLTSIEIPNSVTSIGGYAFSSCDNLTSITVEDGNPVYDSRNNCNAIIETETNTLIAGCQNTIIPNSVTSIGSYAFYDCDNLTSIEIPSGVTYIGVAVFSYCSSLTSIEIPSGVTSIGGSAFFGCSSLTSIEIPNSVTSIGYKAFYFCSNLTSIDFGENSQLTSIEDYAFYNCNNLTSIEIPSGVTYIGEWTFYHCSSLTSIEIPSGVTSIGNSAFYSCYNLTSIEIPSGVTSIGEHAFYFCSSLTSIEIPSSVTSIGYKAFEGCSSLTSIYCYAENVPETGSSAFNYCPSDMIIYVPAKSLDAYKAASPWNEYTIEAMTEFFYDFNDGSLDGWRTFQDDNDNNNWMLNNNQGIDNSYCIYSYSYKNGIIFPDNYIVTTSKYSITEKSTLTFASRPGVSGYFEDNYGVVVSEDNENWTVVWSEKFEEYYNEYTYKTVNLSAYAGKNIYIGFRHYDTDGNVAEYVLIDNVKLSDNSNHWVPDESLYANNMSVIGLIQIDGVNQNSTSLEIGAFCGEEVRGSQFVQYIPALDKYLVFLTIHGEGSEEISFKLYDHFTEEELDLRSPEAITFAVNGTLGSVTNPYILNFSNMVEITAVVSPSEAGVVTGTGIYAVYDTATLVTTPNEGFSFKNWTVNGNVVSTDSEYSFVVTEAVELVANYNYVQTRELKSGWSWFSSFIEFEGEEGLEMMEDALGENGLQIKNQTEFVVNSDGAWYGSLMAANSDMMFMLETSAPQTFTLVGPKVNPEEHPLTVGTNWRWISYPLDINLSVEEALATIVPQTGDYIKSKNAFSQYYEGAGWLGALSTMNPGEGYMYQNVSGTTKTLVYPSESATRSMKANVTAENNYWVPNAEKFAGNMSVIAVVESNGIEMSDYEIAAFVGDEVRGSARPIYIEVLDKHMIFMTVYGSGKEEVTFKYYDINADAIENVTSREEIVFADNATYGSIENAIVLTCGVTGIGENDTETLNVYPNPANINAEISLGTTYDRVEVYNAIGVKVAEYAEVNKIGGIEAAGVYVIKVTNDDATRNCRIVVR